MNRAVFIVGLVALVTCCLAKDFYFEFEHDPNYPPIVSISDISYKFEEMNKFIDISFTMTLYEELNDGTNVSRFNVIIIH